MVDLDPAVDSQKLQARSNGGMFNLAIAPYVLDLGIGDAAVILEEGRQPATRQVAALVDGAGQYGTAVLSKPDGIICATAKK
jgi:hypothetical protein